jgi:DNA/RNA-binding domain of Phe-tRNA-synthetase-like protein
MVRRALRNQELPSINALVDIGNVLSLRSLVPTGGHAIDVVRQDLTLRPATGEEEFVPFPAGELRTGSSAAVEHPLPGEIIFAEGNMVLTRRWTWRQANHTLTLPTTTAIEFNVDGLPPVDRSEVEGVCGQVIELIERYCGGRSRYEVLSPQNPRIRLAA